SGSPARSWPGSPRGTGSARAGISARRRARTRRCEACSAAREGRQHVDEDVVAEHGVVVDARAVDEHGAAGEDPAETRVLGRDGGAQVCERRLGAVLAFEAHGLLRCGEVADDSHYAWLSDTC